MALFYALHFFAGIGIAVTIIWFLAFVQLVRRNR